MSGPPLCSFGSFGSLGSLNSLGSLDSLDSLDSLNSLNSLNSLFHLLLIGLLPSPYMSRTTPLYRTTLGTPIRENTIIRENAIAIIREKMPLHWL